LNGECHNFNAPAGAFNSRSEFNLPKAKSTIVPFLGNLYRRICIFFDQHRKNL